jgi:glucose-6-phosphate 1-dehydrogenase
MVVLILFGVTGDLARKKLLPAVYRLLENGSELRVIGIGRSERDAEAILSETKPFVTSSNTTSWQRLKESFSYLKVDYNNQADYVCLRELLGPTEERIFYFATPAEAFDIVTTHLDKAQLVTPHSKIVFEKPFGSDLTSAIELNSCLKRVFSESQIYRIDHYLGKELVGNIALMRFTNRILEPLWNREHIQSVQIIMNEDIGVENRGSYYDRYGAVEDVVQNHGLQLLSLIAMDALDGLGGDKVRQEKARVLEKVYATDVLLGQYEGYRTESGVEFESNTETFAAVRLEIDNDRWRGVPFFIKAGKCLAAKNTSIHIQFKEVPCTLSHACESASNYFHIRIQPDAGIGIEINTKVPGKKDELLPITLDFCHGCFYGNTPEAYEVLLEDVLSGDQSMFVSIEEIEASWKIIDAMKKGEPMIYAKGSDGPSTLKRWSQQHRIQWREGV